MPTYVEIKDQRIHRVMQSLDESKAPPGWLILPNDWKGDIDDHIDWFTEDMIRIPDDKLIEMGKRFDKRGRWYSKTILGRVLDIIQLDQDPGLEWTKIPPIENEPFQKWDEASGQWIVDKKVKSTLENMTLFRHLDSNNNIELPRLVYHYTSLGNFMEILKTKTFYMFNSYQLNDYKENFVIFDALNRVLVNKKSIIPDNYIKKLYEVFEMKFNMCFTYVSCFTELRDSLSQWRAYGDDGNGICLIINPRCLDINYALPFINAYTEKSISFHNVIYTNEQQNKLIKEVLDNALLYSNRNDKYKA